LRSLRAVSVRWRLSARPQIKRRISAEDGSAQIKMRLPATATMQQSILSAALAASVALSPGLPARAAQRLDTSMTVGALQAQERTIENLFTTATPSVAYITTFVERTDRITMNAMEVAAGTGSGIVWDTDGHVVTNYHVIKGANAATVALTSPDGRTNRYGATLVGFNPDKDVAVLQLGSELRGQKQQPPSSSSTPSSSLTPIALGSSAPLRVGQTTLALGNPFGLDHTLTVGIVSGLGREVTSPSGRPITNVIQTDAAINPGNSGGALLDSSGRLIGMNTAIFSPSGASAGIGFAIPVDTLRYQVETIIKNGKVERPAIGISYVSAGQARALGISRGVLVLDVPRGSAASKSGLLGSSRSDTGQVLLGDVITGVNGERVDTDLDLFRAIDKFSPGDRVTVVVQRFSRSVAGGQSNIAEELKFAVELQAIDAA